MAGRFMKVKRIVIPFISLVLLTSQLAGCASLNSQEFLDEVSKTDEVVIEYNELDESQSTEEDVEDIEQFITQTPLTGPEEADDSSIGVKEAAYDELIELFEYGYESGTIYKELGQEGEGLILLEIGEVASLANTRTDIVLPENYDSQYRDWRAATHGADEVQLFTDCDQTVYATGTVNIRASYSTDSEKLGSLVWGESITCIGTGIVGTNAEGWSKVQLSDGTEAYMVSSYLSTTKPVQQTQPSSSQSSGTTQTPNNPDGNTQQAGSSSVDDDYDPSAHRVDPNTQSAQDAGYKPIDPSNIIY